MRSIRASVFTALALAALAGALPGARAAENRPIAIAIHGGAGTMPAAEMDGGQAAAYRAGLAEALDAGYAVLEQGGTSLDAVTVAVHRLEDNPLFNAGRGAVLTHDGHASLDAAIMDGQHLRAGAVAGVRHVRNPIELARRVMEKSRYLLLSGDGAEEFALEQGFALVPNEYFETPATPPAARAGAAGRGGTGRAGAGARHGRRSRARPPCHIAAATSTGGLVNKRWGRIGDSPLIGAGTYANDASCAVSATGDGEFFIRSVVAHDVCALVEYRGWSLERAAREVIQVKVPRLGGEGGVIALDPAGNVVLEFNTEGMFRALRDSKGRRLVGIYRDPASNGAAR
ncbi:MAG: isoaspartyl peptidase/L-asparaginase [Steroidobacteraceae bacterium]